MKKSVFLIFCTLSLMIIVNSKAQSSIDINNGEIVVVVGLKNKGQGHPIEYGLTVQSPANFIDVTSIPFKIRVENASSVDYFSGLEIVVNDIEGPIISNTSDIPIFPIPDGTLGPIRVPPCPTGQTCDNVNTNETLPQIAAGYSYAPGYHRLLFKLVVDNGNPFNEGPTLAEREIYFTIYQLGKNTIPSTNIISAYPNPVLNNITFDLSNSKSPLNNDDVVLSIYDQSGHLKDKINVNMDYDQKIRYNTDKLLRGTYYYTITLDSSIQEINGKFIKQ